MFRRAILVTMPALLVMSLFLNGCANIRESPSSVVREFVSALQHRDINTAMTYVQPGATDPTKLEQLIQNKWSHRIKDFRVQTRQNDGQLAVVKAYYEELNESQGVWEKQERSTLLQKAGDGWLILYPNFL